MEHSQVVRVFAVSQDPDYDSPWQTRSPTRSTGSGVVIEKGLVLTGAHVVANATFVQIQKLSMPDKLVARVERICHDADLALLRLEDTDALSDIDPAKIGDLPALRQKVSVVGFPVGGEEVSITEGVVSRVEVQRYSHSQRYLLAVTVDAAINDGNSGGPVFGDGKVVGIAFQKVSGADNIGEMVPAPIIRKFLQGYQQGRDPRIPGLGIATQNLENHWQRTWLGMADDQSGVLVVTVEHGNSGDGVLQPGDILMELDGMPIANNGTVQYLERHRTRYDVTICQYFVGDSVEAVIMRDGKHQNIAIELKPLCYLVPRAQYEHEPTYFCFGGLVFQTLTRDFLQTWEGWWDKAPKEFLHFYYSGTRRATQREVVILTHILADKVNVGYDHLYNEGVVSVNGTKVIDMAHFVGLVESSTDVVDIMTSSYGRVLLDVRSVKESHQRILDRYHLTHDRSQDLRKPTL